MTTKSKAYSQVVVSEPISSSSPTTPEAPEDLVDMLEPHVLGAIHIRSKDVAHEIMKQAHFPGCPICPAIKELINQSGYWLSNPDIPSWMKGRRCE